MIRLRKIPGTYFRRLFKELVIFLPLFCLLILIINFTYSPSLFEKLKSDAASNPKNRNMNFALSNFLYQMNNLDEAEKILIGASSKEANSLREKISKDKNAPLLLKNSLSFWQHQDSLNSNSRDIKIKLAILNWKIYRLFESKKALDSALSIDPNNPIFKEINQKLN